MDTTERLKMLLHALAGASEEELGARAMVALQKRLARVGVALVPVGTLERLAAAEAAVVKLYAARDTYVKSENDLIALRGAVDAERAETREVRAQRDSLQTERNELLNKLVRVNEERERLREVHRGEVQAMQASFDSVMKLEESARYALKAVEHTAKSMQDARDEARAAAQMANARSNELAAKIAVLESESARFKANAEENNGQLHEAQQRFAFLGCALKASCSALHDRVLSATTLALYSDRRVHLESALREFENTEEFLAITGQSVPAADEG